MKAVDMGKDVSLFIDFNNLAIRNYFGAKEIIEDPNNIQWGLWRYNVFNQIYQPLWKIKNVKEIILAVDDSNSWRKSFYSRYKESRRKNRDNSVHDWKQIYKHLNVLASEFKHHMPFKVLKVKNAEADDVIAVLVKNFTNPCIIVSGDEDYLQLLRRTDVRLYDPYKHVLLPENPEDFNPKDFLLEAVFCGQKKDDIPNIITPNDWGKTPETEGKRKPGFGKKSFEKIKDDIKSFLNKKYEIKGYGKVDLWYNLKRNRVLMDFDKIPNTIVNRVVEEYNKSGDFPPPENIILFFEKYNMRSFLEDAHRVESKLTTLMR